MRIESLRGPPTTGFDLTIDGDIRNLIGSTTITNDRGSILAGSDAGTETFYRQHRATSTPSSGRSAPSPNPIRLVLFQITHTGEVGVPATLKPVALDAEAGVDLFLDADHGPALTRSPRSTAPITPHIGPIKAGHDAVVILRDSAEGIALPDVGDLQVRIYTPNAGPPGTCARQARTRRSRSSATSARRMPGGCDARHRRRRRRDASRTAPTSRPINARLHVQRHPRRPQHRNLPHVDRDRDHVHRPTPTSTRRGPTTRPGRPHGVTDNNGRDRRAHQRLDHRRRAERQGRPARRPHPRRPASAPARPAACTPATHRRRRHAALAARGSSTPSSTPALDTDDDPTCVDVRPRLRGRDAGQHRRDAAATSRSYAGDNGLGQPGSVSRLRRHRAARQLPRDPRRTRSAARSACCDAFDTRGRRRQDARHLPRRGRRRPAGRHRPHRGRRRR